MGGILLFQSLSMKTGMGEMAMDPYPSGRLRDTDGRLVYMFDYHYEQYLKNLEREEEKV